MGVQRNILLSFKTRIFLLPNILCGKPRIAQIAANIYFMSALSFTTLDDAKFATSSKFDSESAL